MARSMRRYRFSAPKIRYRTRVVKAGRRGVSVAARAAREEKHTLIAVAAAGALGYAERTDIAIPHVAALGVAGTLGVGAFVLGKYTKNRIARHLATGLLSVAAYQLGAGEGGGTSGDFIEGEIPGLEQAYDDDDSIVENPDE